MINLDKTQTVNTVCRYFNILSIDCIVNVHLKYGMTRTYSLDDANSYLIVYRMTVREISNMIVLDLYTY